MAEPLRHRQTKEAATDMFNLQPPRHIPTLPLIASQSFETAASSCAARDAGQGGRWAFYRDIPSTSARSTGGARTDQNALNGNALCVLKIVTEDAVFERQAFRRLAGGMALIQRRRLDGISCVLSTEHARIRGGRSFTPIGMAAGSPLPSDTPRISSIR
jgi:hypothetical protein